MWTAAAPTIAPGHAQAERTPATSSCDRAGSRPSFTRIIVVRCVAATRLSSTPSSSPTFASPTVTSRRTPADATTSCWISNARVMFDATEEAGQV